MLSFRKATEIQTGILILWNCFTIQWLELLLLFVLNAVCSKTSEQMCYYIRNIFRYLEECPVSKSKNGPMHMSEWNERIYISFKAIKNISSKLTWHFLCTRFHKSEEDATFDIRPLKWIHSIFTWREKNHRLSWYLPENVIKIGKQTQHRFRVAKCFPRDILFVWAFKVLKDSVTKEH